MDVFSETNNTVSTKYFIFYSKKVEENIIKVSPETETICCDGGQDGLGHPAVYYSFDNQDKVVCGYCGKIYVKEKE